MKKHRTRRVYIAYDRDEAGEKAAAALAEELLAMGIECFRVQFPRDQDANEFALKKPARREVSGHVPDACGWLGKGKRPSTTAVTQATATPAPQEEREPMENQESTLAATTLEAEPAAKEKTVIEETAAIPGESVLS